MPSMDDFKQLMSTVGELAKSVNSLHAADRRSREGKQPADDKAKAATNPTADDPSSLLALRDAFDDATSEMKLSKGQRSLLREHVMGKRPHPSDVDGVVSNYVSLAGWVTAPTNVAPVAAIAAQPAQAAPARNERPVSDRGSPPVSAVPLEEQNVISMTPSDRDALRKLKGDKWFADRVMEASKGIAFKLR